jgi:predicted kinase
MAKLKLYIFIGYPGAGKTTVAQIINQETGAEHLWADAERHSLFPNPTHEENESRQLYDHLNERTDKLLSEGKNVIFDTNFNHRSDRDLLRQIAAKNNAETVVVWVNTPYEVAKQRAVHSDIKRNGYDFSMSEEQFDAIACKQEPPTEDENYLKIDGTKVDRSDVVSLLNL